MVAADYDPAFIVQAGVMGSISFLFIVSFLVALYFEPTTASADDAKTGLDWWCRRIGLVQATVCMVWSVDMRAVLGIYPLALSWVLTASATALLLSFASVWIHFHALVLFRQLKRSYPLFVVRVLIALPLVDWSGQTLCYLIWAHQNREWYRALGQLIFCLVVWGYMALTAAVSIVLRSQLTRFITTINNKPRAGGGGGGGGGDGIASGLKTPHSGGGGALPLTNPVSPKSQKSSLIVLAGPKSDGNAPAPSAPSGPASPKAPPIIITAANATVDGGGPTTGGGGGADRRSPPGSGTTSPTHASAGAAHAAGTAGVGGGGGGLVIDMTHIYRALRTLSAVTITLQVLGLYSTYEAMVDVVEHIWQTDREIIPANRKFVFINTIVPLIIWIVIGLKVFYCWPLYRSKSAAAAYAFSPTGSKRPNTHPAGVGGPVSPHGPAFVRVRPPGTGGGAGGGVVRTNPPHHVLVAPRSGEADTSDLHRIDFAGGAASPPATAARRAIGAGGGAAATALQTPALGEVPEFPLAGGGGGGGGQTEDAASRIVPSNRVQSGVDNRDHWRTDLPGAAPTSTNGNGGTISPRSGGH